MIRRVSKSSSWWLLAILVLGFLFIFVKEKLDNRIYVKKIPESEIPLALNGDLALARTAEIFVVHDARTGVTTTLPKPDMKFITYDDKPSCAARDQIVFQRIISVDRGSAKWADWTNDFGRFRWSVAGLELIATDHSLEIGRLVLNPWTCAAMPDGTSYSYRFEDGQDGSDRTVLISHNGRYWDATLPDHPDADEFESGRRRHPIVVPAVDVGRFLIHEEEQIAQIVYGPEEGMLPARDELWIVADNATGIARQIVLPKGRWASSPMRDTDSLRCWSCGCDCFRHVDYALSGNHIFSVLTGELMFVRDAGIHRLDLDEPEKGWVHVLPAALNSPVIFSPDGCNAAVSDGRVRIVDLCD